MWSPQLYIQQGRTQQVRPEVLKAAVWQLDEFYSKTDNIPALLTLGHLAQRSEVPYGRLRAAVERRGQSYNHFTIRKRSGGRRTISVPNGDLLMVQRWLTKHILNKQSVHPASHAFRPKSSIVCCANRHTGARWLVKMDISGLDRGFFWFNLGNRSFQGFSQSRLGVLPGAPRPRLPPLR